MNTLLRYLVAIGMKNPEIKLYQVSIIKGRFEVVTRRKFDNKFTD